ncbi:MAG TPA: nucleotide exchange factor GrpE [Alphaproteobacteria bacterium]|nr:nucleotide exchange factor GrpE [Alphaproteobacteria bacterium]
MMDDTPNDPDGRIEPTFGNSPGGGAANDERGPSEADARQAPDLSARVGELEAEVRKLKDQALRAMAEAENTRRRAQREIEENNKYAVSNIARDVLPIADNLRRALDGISEEARKADERLDKFATGVELTEREFLATLERHHIKRIEALGKPFDHNLHQAVMQVEVPDKAAGTVVQVLQSGFTIHDRLLRPAMVAVAKGEATSAGARMDTTA